MSLTYDMFKSHAAGYDELLSKAVARLRGAAPESRRAVYERARAALQRHLLGQEPPASEDDVAAAERALTEAIDRVEASESANKQEFKVTQTTEARNDHRNWLSGILARASCDDSLAPASERPPAPTSSAMSASPEAAKESAPLTPRLQNSMFSPRREPGRSAIPAKEPKEGRPMSRLDELNRILRKLHDDSPGIEASALISEDGLMIASALAPNMEETRIAGMAATLQSLGSRAAIELARGTTQEVIIRGERGYAVLIGAGRGTVLLALANETAKLGLIFFDVHEAIKAVQKVL